MGLFLFSLVWCAVATNMQLRNDHSQISAVMIFNFMTIDNLIFPFLMALLGIRLVQPEREYKMISVLELSGESLWKLFLAKLNLILIVILAGTTLQAVMIWLFTIMSYGNVVDLPLLIKFCISVLGSGYVIGIIQLSISFYIKKTTIPLCIGLGGSFLSLITSGFLPRMVTIFIPWQYVSVVNPLVLKNGSLVYYDSWFIFFIVVMMVGILMLMTTSYLLKNKGEVSTS